MDSYFGLTYEQYMERVIDKARNIVARSRTLLFPPILILHLDKMFPKKQVDNRKKNTKRKITPEVAYEVRARDGYCIFSLLDSGSTKYCKGSGSIEEIHHAFFGLDANYGPNRNDPDQLVGLCNGCHDHIHSRGGQDYREHCIAYLK